MCALHGNRMLRQWQALQISGTLQHTLRFGEPLVTAIKRTFHVKKNRVISFFKMGKSIFRGFALFIFMVYVIGINLP